MELLRIKNQHGGVVLHSHQTSSFVVSGVRRFPPNKNKENLVSKPELELTGQDGNVFFILGKAIREARRVGWTKEKIEKFKKEATSGDYDHALQTCMDYFEVT